MKFLGFFSPADITEYCKEGKVMVRITVTREDGTIITHTPTGDVEEIDEQILSQYGREIRKWTDLFEFDNPRMGQYLTDEEKENLI
jgi:hypothetical protein